MFSEMFEHTKTLWITFAILIVVWLFQEGYNSPNARSAPFINAPAPISSGTTFGPQLLEEIEVKQSQILLPFRNDTEIAAANKLAEQLKSARVSKDVRTSIEGVKGTRGSLEVITLVNRTEKETIPLSGGSVQSLLTERGGTIPSFVSIPTLGGQNTFEPLTLSPGETAYIKSGPSPLGISFQINKCFGYFDLESTLSPRPKTSCPDLLPKYKELYGEPAGGCADLLRTLPRCTIPPASSLAKVEDSRCRQFIQEVSTYDGCVDVFRNDSDFLLPRYYLYLGSRTKLWNMRSDSLIIRDASFNPQAGVSY